MRRGFFKGAGLSSKTEKMVTVPDVRGMTFEDAQAELKKKDEVTVVESEQNWKRYAQQMV